MCIPCPRTLGYDVPGPYTGGEGSKELGTERGSRKKEAIGQVLN
jgi:hypothetical protein